MQRFAHYFGIIASLAFFVLIVVFANEAAVVQIATLAPSATSSTVSVEPITLPYITVPSVESFASTTIAQNKKAALPTPKSTPPSAPVAAPVPPPATFSSAEFDASASALRAALVNIICYVPPNVGLHSISGSGVFIDSKGIILTNAHIAQYFLLADKGANCTIRSGSPAVDRYEAALIYIPSAWLRANATVLTETLPHGTGEYDFAFLAVSRSATSFVLPSVFPSIPLAITPPTSNTPVVIASYGAQFIGPTQVRDALFPTIVFGSVKDIFTFAATTIDVLALGGSAAAQEGSSGGGVADGSGKLVGTITTSTVEGTTDTRSLDAITASYIRSAYASETGQALDLLLSRPTTTSIADFAPQISTLEAIITADLP